MLLASLLISACLTVSTDEPATARKVDFTREVRPIFETSCLGCHGSKKRKGGLALDRKTAALAGGDDGPVIVPGRSTESRLVRYVSGLEPDHMMPPDDSGDVLTPAQVATLRAWVDQGAEWPTEASSEESASSDHWAFRKPIRPELPAVHREDWSRNPIDLFVLARLERERLQPSPEADREGLIRRLNLDLIGLPPTLEEIDAFQADSSPDAYEKVVDRLLNSPHYGERWARRWLDGARYADTNGYEKDRERSIWPYRDWVIRALNADLPFDRFTIEQIAGDLLPGATLDQKIATGFHRNTMINEEGGIDVEEFRFASLVDRVATTGAVWLGLTVQCAQCHTHKFDPITQREYYRFLSVFDNVDEPEIPLPDPEIAARREAIEKRIAGLEASLADRFPEPTPERVWTPLVPVSVRTSQGTTLTTHSDGSILASGESPAQDSYEIEVETNLEGVTGLRLEALIDPSLPGQGPGRAPNGNFVLTELSVLDEQRQPLKLGPASADVSQPGFDVSRSIDGSTANGWAVDVGPGLLNKDHSATFGIKAPVTAGSRRWTVRLDQTYGGRHTLGRFRLSLGRDVPGPKLDRRGWLEVRRREWEAGLKPTRWSPVAPIALKSARNATLRVLADQSVLASGDKPNNDVYTVEIPADRRGTSAIRLEVLPHESLPDQGPGRAHLFSVGNFLLTEVEAMEVSADGKTSRPIRIASASADFEETGRPASNTIDAKVDTGWSIGGAVGQPHALVLRLAEPIQAEPESRIRLVLHQFTIHQTTIGRFRLSTTTDPDPPGASGLPAEVESIALIPAANRSAEQSRLIERQYLKVAPELAPARQEIASLRRSLPAFATTMVVQERPSDQTRTTRIRKRGEFLRPTDPVEPGVPAVLPPLPKGDEPARLKLARWLVSADNPLTARVLVNRSWQAFFGRGIVPTIEDFGTRGEKPSHPELLDWLATEFIRQGWSQKAIHRLIVTSATYRQSSKVSPELLARDPRNELLARGARFRVDAEMVRDLALSASGLLNPAIGGPSVYPPQPEGVTSLAYGQPGWPTSKGPDRYRRALYTFTKRTAPFAASATFDMPTSEVACVRRERSNTPLQALTLLNDPAFVEAARAMGRRIVREGPTDLEGRAKLAFRLCVGRVPKPDELAAILAFQKDQARRLRSGEIDPKAILGSDTEGDPIESAVWVAVSRVFLNLDETITRE